MSKRAKRKLDHIKHFLNQQKPVKDDFQHIQLRHNALPEIDYDQIDFSTLFLDKRIKAPIMINAITGGVDEVHWINEALARFASEFHIPMAVGSQSIALKDKGCIQSFKVVRDEIGQEGIVIGNLSANMQVDQVKRAIDMIQADAIQLHLNVAQEIIMPEGDRHFKGLLSNIEAVVKGLDVPVIAKEVGFGINGDVAKRLGEVGIRYIDVGGAGGTNFIEIEDSRREKPLYEEFYNWGLSTPQCLAECRSLSADIQLISSGGIHTASQVIKSLCLGAQVVGISGMILRDLLENGEDLARENLKLLIEKCKIYMLLLGADKVSKLGRHMITL